MTIEEIRKDAPLGATGYITNNDGLWYWKGFSVWFGGEWISMQSPSINIKPL